MPLYRITSTGLNFRRRSSVSSEILDRHHKNTLIWGVHQSKHGHWMAIEFGGNQTGWVSAKYITPVTEQCPSWLTIAVKELGIKEYPGELTNPRILEYLKTTTLGFPKNENDETHWCSCFVNWCIEQASLTGTQDPMARSWLHWGKKLETPRLGCIVVFSRPPNPRLGHVGFYAGETSTQIQVFGGNQGNQVNVSLYPKERFLDYRWHI